MKNKFLVIGFILAVIATLLGIISTTGIQDSREVLRAFHFGSTALFLGLLSVFSLVVSKLWKE